ncbi:MAG: carboxylesterase family protein [Lachnospiraceae bacterium]|nr:carboxylesterase family protein [Lachnospiraceae bacterium]
MNVKLTGSFETKRGMVRGYCQDEEVLVFKGIPYAAPPVGDLRWKEAVPHPEWDGVLDCVEFGNSAPQNPMDEVSQLVWTEEFQIQNRNFSEDCLTLNLWTKKDGKDMPVVVYFYGGGYVSGGSSCPIYDGTELVKNGIIYVTFNHREGTLALLAAEGLAEESESGKSGNYMLSDDILALKWVKENIRAFGGDPENVTIWGQSSGAGQVNALSVSPMAKGLFKQVISMGYNNYEDYIFGKCWLDYSKACEQGQGILDSLGCDVEEARKKDFGEFLKLPQMGVIQIDGRYIPGDFKSSIKDGRMDGIPFMMGAVPGDTVVAVFVRSYSGSEDKAEFKAHAAKFFGEENAEKIFKAYDLENRTVKEAMGKLKEDLLLATMLSFAEGRKERGDADKTFVYYFVHPMPGPMMQRFGAFHSCEVPYFLNYFSPLRDEYWKEEDFALGRTASAELISFIKTGKPKDAGFTNSDGSNYFRIDAGEMENMVMDEKIRDLWLGIFKGGMR